LSNPQLPPANGSASATTFQGPDSAHAIDSARSGSSRTTRERSGTSASRAKASSWRRAPWAASRRSCVMPSADMVRLRRPVSDTSRTKP
jgi:hypothetical protein